MPYESQTPYPCDLLNYSCENMPNMLKVATNNNTAKKISNHVTDRQQGKFTLSNFKAASFRKVAA